MANILIIDDDKMICESLSRIFRDMGHEVLYSLTLHQGLKTAESNDFDVVFLDVRLPDGNGIKQLPVVQSMPSCPEVIIITGYADADSAELAIKNNAWDYIKKPASIDSVTLALTRVLQYRKEKHASQLSTGIKHIKREGIIGTSPEIQQCLDLVVRVADSHANVLISGETGTGKELFAKAIHANSFRCDKAFVVVDCASLPKTLIESILFGHTKGAYTGADKAQEGLIKHSDQGTLFLDEIGELPLSTQKTFLRVLQERRFRPLGGTQEIKSNFRLVSASNRNLDEMVKSNRFRSDLLFRIRSVTIDMPPLRDRIQDVKDIASAYLIQLCESHNLEMKECSPDFFDMLTAYHWPGNVRELYSALEWTIVQSLNEPTLFSKHLPPRIRIQKARSSFAPPSHEKTDNDICPINKLFPKWKVFRKDLIAKGEKQYLQDLMTETKGNIKIASEISGLSQPRLYELLRKHKISTR